MAGTSVGVAMSPYFAPVHINVGGTIYNSCLATLTKYPNSKLAKLFNRTLPVDPVKNRYFLDRDGKMFRHILNFLRNSELLLPDTFSEFGLLKKEAAYFEIEDLITALEDNRQSNNGTENQEEQSSDDDNATGTCKAQLQRRERKRRKKRNKITVKDKRDNEMFEVDTENEFTEEEADLKKGTLEINKSSNTIASAKHLSTVEETNKGKDKSQVPDVSEVLQVQSSMETVVVEKEFVCVLTDGCEVKQLWCSDKNFKLEILESPDFNAFNFNVCPKYTNGVLNMSQSIWNLDFPCQYGFNAYGFTWVALLLFKYGYKFKTSSGSKTVYNFFVK